VNSLAHIRLLHFTDPHLFADESQELYGVRTAAAFEATLARALADARERPDAVLVTGDIADDGQETTYRRFCSTMQRHGLPVLCAPGNHEDVPVMSRVFNGGPVQHCGSRRMAGWRIVLLDSHVPGEDWGRLGEAELGRLDEELAAARDEHVLVCLHHHPVAVGSPWLDAFGLRDAPEMARVIARHGNVRGVLFGHVHQASDRVADGVRMLSTPSTCAQFTPRTESCVMDRAPPGYRWLRLTHSGAIETDVVWLEELRRAERPPDSRQAEVEMGEGHGHDW
jgi:Icc protein